MARRKPVLLPFEVPRPRPILQIWKTYILGDRPIRQVVEHWRIAEIDRVPFPCQPDPHDPTRAISLRLIDLRAGAIIPVASDDEVSSHLKR